MLLDAALLAFGRSDTVLIGMFHETDVVQNPDNIDALWLKP